MSLPSDLKDKGQLTNAIIGLEIKVDRIQAKFKLGQNKEKETLSALIESLEESKKNPALLQLIKDHRPSK
jgi:predicted FMN-binding regulatory protein PaiB